MAKFQSTNPGVWFYFDSDDESKGGVCIRELSSDEYDKIHNMTTKTRKKVIRGMVVDDIKTDTKLANRLRWDACILDWKEVYLDNKLLECNIDNKCRMMKVTNFVKFLADSLEELVNTNESIEEARLKNSKTSSNGNRGNQTVESV